MHDGMRRITTMTDATTASILEIHDSQTRDQIILIRDVLHALRTEAAREVKVTVQQAKFTLTIEAKK